MNNDLEQFSEERLMDMQKHITAGMRLGHADALLIRQAIDIALAAKQAKPVGWLLSGGGTKNIVSFDSGNAYADPLREVTPLYATPQTRHAGLVSWIECSERMPETYLNVLLTDEADDMCIGQLESHDDTDFFVVGCPRYKATHWMALPAAPKPES